MEPQKPLINASIVGGVLAVLGIGLFLLIYAILGSLDVASAPRLFGALCAPPVVIAALAYIYAQRRA